MDILLFGGAFDPVHLGHVNILKAAMQYRHFDKVIVMPTGTPGHKKPCIAPFAIRAEMARLAFSNLGEQICISSFEGDRFEKSYSYLTIQHLQAVYPNAQIWFLIGSDSAIHFTQWKNWDEITKSVKLLVFQRQQQDQQALQDAIASLRNIGAQIEEVKHMVVEVSSSSLREQLSQKKDISCYIPKDVYALIEKYDLYDPCDLTRWAQTSRLLACLLLDEKRANHTFCVEKLAVQLAERHNVDKQKARICALLHDCMKQASKDILLHRALQSDIISKIKAKPLHTLHGFAAADFAQKELGIADEEMLWALKSHTCGRPNMTNLEKVIYLADMLCEGRNFEEKDYLLSLAFESLDQGMYQALKASIAWLTHKGQTIDHDSIQALEYFSHLVL